LNGKRGVTFEEAAKQLAAAGIESPRTEARLLYAHALGVHRDATLSNDLNPTLQQAEAFAVMVARRIAREPFAYITGRREFWSLDFQVGPGVLVPRPETETLIEEALRVIPDKSAPLAIADLGTGSGALLIAALKEFPRTAGLGLDSSPDALSYAKRNVFAHDLSERAKLRLDDWTAAPDDSFDLVFSNPPYIPEAEIQGLDPEVSRFEPRAALNGGPDGLEAYRSLAGHLPRMLKKGGRAILEIGAGQRVEPIFQGSGLRLVRTTPDLGGIPRAVLLEKT
jgi:release factor glutamine methyltransferase